MDARKYNGGHSTKGAAGRKPKEDEDRIRTLSINALESIYGSEEKAFQHIADLSIESYPHLKLLLEYAYGKPKETKQINTNVEQPLFVDEKPFPVHKLSDACLLEFIGIEKGLEGEELLLYVQENMPKRFI